MYNLSMSSLSVLVVDDQYAIRKLITKCLASDGHTIMHAINGDEAMHATKLQYFDIVFLDLMLGEERGMDLIKKLHAIAPWMKIIIITGHATVENAVTAMKHGASDFIRKPFSPKLVKFLVSKLNQVIQLERKVEYLEGAVLSHEPCTILETKNHDMKRVLSIAKTAAVSEATMLLTGESGTGKNIIGQTVHEWSKRNEKPFQVVSCPALPAELLESELFGHVKGAFTGAVRDNPGRITLCEGGTILLDEIADIPVSLQAKLLHFIQYKSYQRIGDPALRTADVRVLAATNADLQEKIAQGVFREDLYYRLNVIHLTIPPLRERKEDILMLAENCLKFFSIQNHKRFSGFTRDAEQALTAYPWPGNVRELRNAIERSVILTTGEIVTAHEIFPEKSLTGVKNYARDDISLKDLEELHIKNVLAKSASLKEAAAKLGIDTVTLWRKRSKFGNA